MRRVGISTDSEDSKASPVSVFRNTLIVSGGTLLSRLLGFLRLAITIYVLSKTVNDVFQLSRALPNQVYDLYLSSAFSAILIPSFVKVDKSKDRDSYITALFLLSLLFLCVATLLAMMLAPMLVSMFGYSIPGNWRPVVIGLSLWCMPQIFFLGLHSILGQYLNSQNRFIGFAWSPVINNVVTIIGLLIFNQFYDKHLAAGRALEDPQVWSVWPMVLLAGFSTLGVIIQAIVLIVPAYKAGLRFTMPVRIRGLGLRQTAREGGWVVLIVLIGQLNTIATSNVGAAAFAWTQKTGIVVPSYVELNVAALIYILPYALFSLSLINVLFPQISRAVFEKHDDLVKKIILQYESYMVPITVFSAMYLILASLPLAQLLTFFSNYNPYLVALIIAGFGPNVIAFSLSTMFQRLFFANGLARFICLAVIPESLVVVLLSYLSVQLLPAKYWLFGAVLALAVGNIIFWLFLNWCLPAKQKLGILRQLKVFIRPLCGAFLSSLLLCIPFSYIGFLSGGIIQILLRLMVIGVFGGILFIYFGVGKGTRADIYGMLRAKIAR